MQIIAFLLTVVAVGGDFVPPELSPLSSATRPTQARPSLGSDPWSGSNSPGTTRTTNGSTNGGSTRQRTSNSSPTMDAIGSPTGGLADTLKRSLFEVVAPVQYQDPRLPNRGVDGLIGPRSRTAATDPTSGNERDMQSIPPYNDRRTSTSSTVAQGSRNLDFGTPPATNHPSSPNVSPNLSSNGTPSNRRQPLNVPELNSPVATQNQRDSRAGISNRDRRSNELKDLPPAGSVVANSAYEPQFEPAYRPANSPPANSIDVQSPVVNNSYNVNPNVLPATNGQQVLGGTVPYADPYRQAAPVPQPYPTYPPTMVNAPVNSRPIDIPNNVRRPYGGYDDGRYNVAQQPTEDPFPDSPNVEIPGDATNPNANPSNGFPRTNPENMTAQERYLRDQNSGLSMQGGTYFMTLLALFASVGLNVYLGWIAYDTYNRYQELVADLRQGSRRERVERRVPEAAVY